MPKTKLILITTVMTAVSASQGCYMSKAERLANAGHPPAYISGYNDGCSSGEASIGFSTSRYLKDSLRAEKERAYADGWDAGFHECKGQAEMIRNVTSK